MVASRVLPRRACWLIGRARDESIKLTPLRKPNLTRGPIIILKK